MRISDWSSDVCSSDLPLEIKELFAEWLEAHFPDRKAKVLKLVRDTRGGGLYQAEFGLRKRGSGVYADLLSHRFKQAERRLGLNPGPPPLDVTQFDPPKAADRQLSPLTTHPPPSSHTPAAAELGRPSSL